MERRGVCAAVWGNGTQLNLCLGSGEGMEDQEKRTIKGGTRLRKKLKKSQRRRFRKTRS